MQCSRQASILATSVEVVLPYVFFNALLLHLSHKANYYQSEWSVQDDNHCKTISLILNLAVLYCEAKELEYPTPWWSFIPNGQTTHYSNQKCCLTYGMNFNNMPFIHWASVKAAWCCQLGHVALCIQSIKLAVPEVVGIEY